MRASARNVVTAALALALLAAPATAGAAEPTGNTTLVIGAAKARALESRGVTVAGVAGASSKGRETRLQISGGTIEAGAASLVNEGALRFRAGSGSSSRVVRLTALRTQLGPESTLSAKLNGKRRAIFDLKAPPGKLAIDESDGTAQLHGARLVWRRSAAAAIGRRLGTRLPRGALGRLRASAAITFSETPKQGTLGSEPPLLARPAGAIDVGAASVTWHVRDSWIRYSNTQMAPQALEGASAGAPIQEGDHPCPDSPAGTNPTLAYSYEFPFSSGWYDPATGSAALYESGGVRFSYPAHGIDLTTRNPEVEIAGAASRVIFRLRSDAYQDVRAPVLALAVTDPPVESPAGTFTYSAPLRGSLTDDGQAVFAGFYTPPNNGFGCLSVAFTAP